MFQPHPQQQQQPHLVRLNGLCFNCHNPGHWAYACPENPNYRSPINSDQHFPAIHCPCGAGHCRILISQSITNPNRKYYSCPRQNGMHCGYFKWCVELIMERHVREDGADNFRQWLDNSPESLSITSSKSVACQSLTLDDFDFSYEEEEETQLDAVKQIIINIDTSPEDLVTRRDNEQQRFEDLLKSQHEALDALMASNNQLSLLCAKASAFENSSELVKKLSTCEAEIAYRQETLLKITKAITECKESLQSDSQKPEEAVKVSESEKREIGME